MLRPRTALAEPSDYPRRSTWDKIGPVCFAGTEILATPNVVPISSLEVGPTTTRACPCPA